MLDNNFNIRKALSFLIICN